MGLIIIEASILVLLVAFVVYLAMDDRRNQRIRAEEDRNKVLEQGNRGNDPE